MSTKSLLRSTGIISVATAISRVLGFIRDILIARFFGTGASVQAFIVAFRLPNLLRHMVAEGAASSAFVPVLSEYLVKKKKEEFWHLANVLLDLVLIVLMIIVIIGVIFAPLIVRVIAPGFVTDPALLKLTVDLTRIIFPYILLIGLTAYAMGVLNTLKHFSAPAFAPALLNIFVIAAILIYSHNITVTILAFAILISGVMQFLVQVPVLYNKGMRFSIPKSLYHPSAKRIGELLLPRTLSAAVYQLNVLIDTILASLHWIVGLGGIAALWYSNRLIQLPTAVFGTSLATAALPTLSDCYAQKDMERFRTTINFLLRAVFLTMIPATVGFMVLGNHIIKIMFERGEFTLYSTLITGRALFFYAFGLFSYSGIKILVYSFYSMQDTRTPVKTAAAALAVNVVLNLILMWPLKIGGLALATSIAGIFNFSILFYILRKRIGYLGERDIITFLIKTLIAALAMGLVLYLGLKRFDAFTAGKGFLPNIINLILYIIGGIFIYLAALFVLRAKELGKFMRWILRIK